MLIQVRCQGCNTQFPSQSPEDDMYVVWRAKDTADHPALTLVHTPVCPICAEQIREASRRAGYEEGYNKGYDDGAARAADQDVPLAASFDLGYDMGYSAACTAWGELRGYDEDVVSRMTAGVWYNYWGEPDG